MLDLRHLLDICSGGARKGIHRAYARCPSFEGRCGGSYSNSMRRGLEGPQS